MKYEIFDEEGGLFNVIEASQDFVELLYPGRWRLSEEQSIVDVKPENRKITKLAFRNRFTIQEKVAIEIASLDNPSSDMLLRITSATVRTYLQDVASATFIDLNRLDTREGVFKLEEYGIISAGRAAEILDSPIEDIEKYEVKV